MGAAFSLAILLLFVLVLLSMGLGGSGKGKGNRLVSMNFDEPKQQKSAPKPVQPRVVKPVPTPPLHDAKLQKPEATPTPPPDPGPPAFIHMSREDMASADIGKMARASRDTGDDTGAARGGQTGPGDGPGGVHLYAARWYREPRPAEVNPYLKNGAPAGSWATIACRTVDAYHVEDCQELDESPRGSGLARGLRQAAWQFLVWPPRVDGKPQVGTWVRIRFDWH